MRERVSRRCVLHAAGGVAVVGAFAPAFLAHAAGSEPIPSTLPLDHTMVRDFVGMAHRAKDFGEFTAMLDKEPALINATVDWRSGDFETALGAAAHVGNVEGMRLLLDRGARLDLFAAASLGYLDLVKAAINADPRVAHTMGPHGIALMTHAKTNKQDAVVAYLRDIGADDGPGSVSGEHLRRYVGRYEGEAGAIVVVHESGRLMLEGELRGELAHAGKHEFTVRTSGSQPREAQFRMTPIRAYSLRLRHPDGWKESFIVR